MIDKRWVHLEDETFVVGLCDWCGKHGRLDAEEGDQWICEECMDENLAEMNEMAEKYKDEK